MNMPNQYQLDQLTPIERLMTDKAVEFMWEANRLRARVAELEADRAMLDWLEVNFRTNSDSLARWNDETFAKFSSIRDAIAAMREKGQQ